MLNINNTAEEIYTEWMAELPDIKRYAQWRADQAWDLMRRNCMTSIGVCFPFKSKKGNEYLMTFNSLKDKRGKYLSMREYLLLRTERGTYAFANEKINKSKRIDRNSEYPDYNITMYTPHFFERYLRRHGLAKKYPSIMVQYFQRSEYTARAVIEKNSLTLDHGGDYEFMKIHMDGFGLGIVEDGMNKVLTFLCCSDLNRRQQELLVSLMSVDGEGLVEIRGNVIHFKLKKD